MTSLVQRMKARSQKTSLAETQQEMTKFQQMPLIEMRQQTIDFGEKYRGKSYEQAFQDAVWAEWFVSTYAKSNKTAHQRFLIFVEKQLDAETMNPDARIEPGPSVTSLNKTKAKEVSVKATPKMPVETSLQDWDALSEEDLPNSHVLDLQEQMSNMQANHHNMHQRMCGIETALQELIVHFKGIQVKTEN